MHGRVLDPVGVEVTAPPLDELPDEAIARLKALLAEHGVVVLPGQWIDDATFLAFLQRFGALAFTTGEAPLPGFPDLNAVSNLGRVTPPRSTFHVDTSYVARPPAYTALRAVEIPEEGGETVFTNQYRAYDTLSPRMRSTLAGRTIRHCVTGLDLGPGAETEAEHPVFRPHPLSRRTALYLSTPARCTAISGMGADEGRETIASLFAHSTHPGNAHRHRWAPGDVVMWDNGCVMHKADHSGVVGRRVLHRGMIAGYCT